MRSSSGIFFQPIRRPVSANETRKGELFTRAGRFYGLSVSVKPVGMKAGQPEPEPERISCWRRHVPLGRRQYWRSSCKSFRWEHSRRQPTWISPRWSDFEHMEMRSTELLFKHLFQYVSYLFLIYFLFIYFNVCFLFIYSNIYLLFLIYFLFT